MSPVRIQLPWVRCSDRVGSAQQVLLTALLLPQEECPSTDHTPLPFPLFSNEIGLD